MNLGRAVVGVTGAGGFIGSYLTERLIGEAARVRALVRYNSRNDRGHLESRPPAKKKNVEVVLGDITDAGCVREFVKGCDVVYHLAVARADAPHKFSSRRFLCPYYLD
jgi:dTDP-glucose 4,6-dehydratase